jgi:DNA mismatch repair protein MutS
MGDFYETFDDDAKILSRELDIALTSREMGKGNKIPLAGIPFHSLNTYIPKLVTKGYKIAICEQTSVPKDSKGIVDREVIRIITPGTVTEDSLLSHDTNNYLASICIYDNKVGLSYVDITTSEFSATTIDITELESEISRLMPKEILIPKETAINFNIDKSIIVTCTDYEITDFEFTYKSVCDFFGVKNLIGFECEVNKFAVQTVYAILSYIKSHNKFALNGITSLSKYATSNFMVLDEQTRKNLELFSGGKSDSQHASLYYVLNKTKTAMGSRLLRNWISKPLIDINELNSRLNVIDWLTTNSYDLGSINKALSDISDLERLMSKVSIGSVTPRDLIGILKSLESGSLIKNILNASTKPNLTKWMVDLFEDNLTSTSLLKSSINQDTPNKLGTGKSIQKRYSQQLDSLMEVEKKSQIQIAELEKSEQIITGIKSLKVGYNKVFGYYIEVSNSNIDSVPDNYIRKQTLVGGERYITPQLKSYEEEIFASQNKISILESEIYKDICVKLSRDISQILKTAKAIAIIDVFCSLSKVAIEQSYIKPTLSESNILHIKNGRHPIIENIIGNQNYIPNDIILGNNDADIIILTGPNMSGKSTYLKQIGLIALLAQIGSYVPASEAIIGLSDRIFTRVGLQDDLTLGQSTFMVEMVETALILNNATSKSLIILDEVGRGTSTYDGLAIAQSVIEHIHNDSKLKCRTIFATHYHELIDIADKLTHAKNFHVMVNENKGNVIFLRRIQTGGASKSYGIHVAQLAGLPSSVIDRAAILLEHLETANNNNSIDTLANNKAKQLSLIDNEPDQILNELNRINIDLLTPLDAMNLLYKLKNNYIK